MIGGMTTRGIHVVWTTYMTWLPGDSRGHWSALFDVYGRLRAKGHRLHLPDAATLEHAQRVAVDEPKVLTPAERVVVAHEISQHVRWPSYSPRLAGGGVSASIQARGNTAIPPGKPGAMCDKPVCYAAAIEDNHVHLLFGPVNEDVGKFVGRLKGRTSSELKKLPINRDRQRLWTGGYWKVFLFDDEAIRSVARYIEQHNVRRGVDASPHAWVSPLNI